MSTICTNCRNNPCVMSCEEKTKCPDYDEGKPIAYNHARAEQIIKQLESELKLEKALWKTLAKQNDELQEEIDRLKAENDILAKENEALLLRADRFEAERNELKFENEELKAQLKQADEAYDSQGKQLLEALEKQIPKKLKDFYCPVCSHYFEDGEDRNYCPCCGQHIDWSDADE